MQNSLWIVLVSVGAGLSGCSSDRIKIEVHEPSGIETHIFDQYKRGGTYELEIEVQATGSRFDAHDYTGTVSIEIQSPDKVTVVPAKFELTLLGTEDGAASAGKTVVLEIARDATPGNYDEEAQGPTYELTISATSDADTTATAQYPFGISEHIAAE